MYNNILDVKGIKVGQAQDLEGLTGCTVVICEKGATCGVDVRGGGSYGYYRRSYNKSYGWCSQEV